MTTYEKSLKVMEELFSGDVNFSMATVNPEGIPSVRVVDSTWIDGALYFVTNAKSMKVRELEKNPNVALCRQLMRISGLAQNIGHPLIKENKALRERLTQVFAPWYFAHNNEDDESMCYVRLVPTSAFIFKDGTGYSIDFEKQSAEDFPFENYIIE